MNKITIKMTDDAGHFWLNGKLFKLKRYRSADKKEMMKGMHRGEYVEVSPVEYDSKIEILAKRIAAFPQVDLLDVLRDALYDMPLNHLDNLQKKLAKEEARASQSSTKPRVETRRGERGTCVELRIGGRYGMELRV